MYQGHVTQRLRANGSDRETPGMSTPGNIIFAPKLSQN
jgi:hypothetical protein